MHQEHLFWGLLLHLVEPSKENWYFPPFNRWTIRNAPKVFDSKTLRYRHPEKCFVGNDSILSLNNIFTSGNEEVTKVMCDGKEIQTVYVIGKQSFF